MERAKPNTASGQSGGQRKSQDYLMLQWVEDDGKSERLIVMVGIGDETIAPTRKRADFHLVTLRKKGLFNRNPTGKMLLSPPGDDCVFL